MNHWNLKPTQTHPNPAKRPEPTTESTWFGSEPTRNHPKPPEPTPNSPRNHPKFILWVGSGGFGWFRVGSCRFGWVRVVSHFTNIAGRVRAGFVFFCRNPRTSSPETTRTHPNPPEPTRNHPETTPKPPKIYTWGGLGWFWVGLGGFGWVRVGLGRFG